MSFCACLFFSIIRCISVPLIILLLLPPYLQAQAPTSLNAISFTEGPSALKINLTWQDFQDFKKQILLEPSLISRRQDVLRKLSEEQIAELIHTLQLGHHSFLYPVRIKGKKLTYLLGRDTRELSVMAIWNGKLQAIPYQFDEYDNKSNYIYIKNINPFPIDGTEFLLDGGDELTFMYRDSGIERYQKEKFVLESGVVEQELAFEDILGRKRYAYIVSGSAERSDLDYVDTPLSTSSIQTSFYNMTYKPENFLEIKDFRPRIGKASDERVVDMIYLKVSTNIITNLIKFDLDSRENIRVQVLGVKDGPVRSVMFLKINVLVGGMSIFSMYSEMNIYEQGWVLPNRVEVGKGLIFTKLFKNPEIIIFIDMHGLEGGKVSADAFTNKQGRLEYGVIDGKMDEIEKRANKNRKPGEWVWLNSGLGWDVFMTLSFPEDKFEGMETSLYYLDSHSKLTEGESFLGAGPRLGMRIKGLPKNINKLEDLDLEYAFWFPDSVGKHGPRQFYKHHRSPPLLHVNGVKN